MKNKLEIKNLKIETDGKIIVRDLNLTINSGEIHILMGSNGAGKSSLVNALLGHPKYKITEGKILFNNKDITHLASEKKARLGLFLSMQYLPEIEGVTMSSFLHKAYKYFKGEEISILDFYEYLEKKAEELHIDNSFLSRYLNFGFSGGEKKQSEALQLAVLEPTIAFLDEIDSGVDMDSLEKIVSAIKTSQKKGTGFLLVTHYDHLPQKIAPNFVHIMNDGEIIKSGDKNLIKEIKEKGLKFYKLD